MTPPVHGLSLPARYPRMELNYTSSVVTTSLARQPFPLFRASVSRTGTRSRKLWLSGRESQKELTSVDMRLRSPLLLGTSWWLEECEEKLRYSLSMGETLQSGRPGHQCTIQGLAIQVPRLFWTGRKRCWLWAGGTKEASARPQQKSTLSKMTPGSLCHRFQHQGWILL